MSSRRNRDRTKSALTKLDELPRVSYEEVAQATYGGESGNVVAESFGAIEATPPPVKAESDGAVRAYSYRLTGIGLDPLALAPDRDSWEKLGQLIFRLDGAMQWLIGDWLLQGESNSWGKHEQIADALGYDVKTLYDYRYVARHVPYDMRHEDLSFGHHKLVARLESEVQQLWLERAAQGDFDAKSESMRPWSISRMRREMRSLSAPAGEAETPFERNLRRIDRELTRRKWNGLPAAERRRRYRLLHDILKRMGDWGLD